ncbi:MAG: hypothetical protein O8C65_15235 [Candidatus Methanoperedens sp.]|nr:hypothetical protein [Candidatus Methanoperedens sp.]
MIHEFFEGISLADSVVYFEFFDMLAVFGLLLFAHQWYTVLKACASKKSLPKELIDSIKQ